MITSKERAKLRSLANGIDAIFNVGKNGVDEAFIAQLHNALEKRELIKISVLNNSGMEAREASDMICEELGCEGVQTIGSKFVIYRKSSTNPKIEL
ncbi:MAG: YhbY family RNA-binding protein [Clostridium sp.]